MVVAAVLKQQGCGSNANPNHNLQHKDLLKVCLGSGLGFAEGLVKVDLSLEGVSWLRVGFKLT